MIAAQLLVLLLAAEAPAAAGALSPPPLAAPAPPAVSAPAPSSPSPPRHIDDLDKPLTGAVPQGSYEVGIQGAFARAENLKGPLDGSWVLSEGAAKLYRFQLDDPGFTGGPVQGAFQDLSAQGALGGSGFVDEVARVGDVLTMSFEARGAAVALSLEAKPGGTYTGKIVRAGVSRDVTLARP